MRSIAPFKDILARRLLRLHPAWREVESLPLVWRPQDAALRRLADCAPEMIYRIRMQPRAHFDYISPAAKAVTGYEPDEFYAEPGLFLRLVHPDDRAAFEAIRLTEPQNDAAPALRVIRKDGSVIWTEQRGVVVVDDRGWPAAIEGVIRDITRQKHTEMALTESLAKLRGSLDGAVSALAALAEHRDPYTAGHQRRVAELATRIARELDLPEDRVQGIGIAASLHDIGKIHVPAEILNKPGRMTEVEMRIIRSHPTVGYEVLKGVDFPWPVAEIVLQHHERLDGSGYPRGLSDGEILPESRILAVADVIEAVSSHRPYRPAAGLEKALQEVSLRRGILFDPTVVEACTRVVMERGLGEDAPDNHRLTHLPSYEHLSNERSR